MARLVVFGPKEYILKIAEFAAIELGKIDGFEKYGAGFSISGVSKQEAIDMIPDASETEP